MSDPFRLEGQLALITGGGSGLGRAMAVAMSEAGARVVIAGRREETLCAAVEAIGKQASYEVHDVADYTKAAQLVRRVEEKRGPISILVNNAGNHLKRPAADTTEDDLLNVFHTHVTGAFALSRIVGPRMAAEGRGSILFVASMASLLALPNVLAYTVAKTAVVGLVRALTAEWAPRGVRVNAVAPGWIESPMLEKALRGDAERRQKILSRTPMGSFGCDRDIAHAAVYLASEAARFVTGVVLPVDGGASIGF